MKAILNFYIAITQKFFPLKYAQRSSVWSAQKKMRSISAAEGIVLQKYCVYLITKSFAAEKEKILLDLGCERYKTSVCWVKHMSDGF